MIELKRFILLRHLNIYLCALIKKKINDHSFDQIYQIIHIAYIIIYL